MNEKTCPICRSPIPDNAPGGLCPACVLRNADEPPADAADAPSLADVAAAFPKLQILRLIGHGGMGFVYQARQPELDRTVALKILSPALRCDPAFEERFAREARVLGKLQHPNIVTLHEHGESGGYFYLLMEYIDGVNLRQAMSAGRFTPEQALAIVPAICDALQSAHAQGVWHRDIKPENILLDKDGRVKIADFGIARILGDPQRNFTLTRTGGQLGSAAYMAPEQYEKPHSVDHRADIYSLGVVIYEMLTGELPLGRFPLPSQRAAVNARIDEIVLRTLEKERELRQQSAGEVKTEIERSDDPISIATVQTNPRGQLPSIAFIMLLLGLYGAFSINRLFPQPGNPVLMVSLCCLALAMIMGLFSWRHALGRWTTVLTLICVCVPVAKSLIAWPWGQAVAAKVNAKQDASGSILDKREPRPKVTPPPSPASDLPPRDQSPAEPSISVFDVFLAMNGAAVAGNAEEFRSHMAKSGHAGGALMLPIAEYMELFAGKPGEKTSSEIPNREGFIHLDVMFEEPAGMSGKKRGFRFLAEEGHWRYVFDGFVEHRVSSRFEVTPPAPNVEALLQKGVFGPCTVMPVPGTDSQFDIVATCLNLDEAITWANHFARHAEKGLKVRGLDVFVRVIKPARQPEKPRTDKDVPEPGKPADAAASPVDLKNIANETEGLGTEPTLEARLNDLEEYMRSKEPKHPQYRAVCRVEVRLKRGNTEALLNEALGKFCTVVPVSGVEHQFDLVVTDPDPAQTSRLANYLGQNAEGLLKEREVHGTVRIIKPAERPEKPCLGEEEPAPTAFPRK